MPRAWVMFTLFLSSYAPLFFLVGVRSVGRSDAIATVCGFLIIGGAAGTYLFLSTAPRKPRAAYRLVQVESRDGDIVAYVATYLLPFMTVFTGKWQDVASLGAFIAFLGFVHVRSRIIYVNPVLLALGYRLWRVIPVTDGSSDDVPIRWPRYFLAHAPIRAGQRIWTHRVTEDLLLYDCDVTDATAKLQETHEEEEGT